MSNAASASWKFWLHIVYRDHSDHLVLDGPWFKLPSRKVLVASSADKAPVLTLPDEYKGKQEHHEADGSNGVEDVGHSNRLDPLNAVSKIGSSSRRFSKITYRNQGEDKDCTQHVPHKRQRDNCVANDLHSLS